MSINVKQQFDMLTSCSAYITFVLLSVPSRSLCSLILICIRIPACKCSARVVASCKHSGYVSGDRKIAPPPLSKRDRRNNYESSNVII